MTSKLGERTCSSQQHLVDNEAKTQHGKELLDSRVEYAWKVWRNWSLEGDYKAEVTVLI